MKYQTDIYHYIHSAPHTSERHTSERVTDAHQSCSRPLVPRSITTKTPPDHQSKTGPSAHQRQQRPLSRKNCAKKKFARKYPCRAPTSYTAIQTSMRHRYIRAHQPDERAGAKPSPTLPCPCLTTATLHIQCRPREKLINVTTNYVNKGLNFQ